MRTIATIIATMAICILSSIDTFIERHIIAEYKGPDACFDCNRGGCSGCPLNIGE